MFYGTPATHVGLYAGEGRMWDAPRTGKTTGLHTLYRNLGPITYRRALTPPPPTQTSA